jgi:hypothetical protein
MGRILWISTGVKKPPCGGMRERIGKVQTKKSPLAGAFWRGRDYRVLKALESLS